MELMKKRWAGLLASVVHNRDIHESTLPVLNMLNDSSVPANATGDHELSDLAYEDLFLVIYQVRSNLFHGKKDPMERERDLTRVPWQPSSWCP